MGPNWLQCCAESGGSDNPACDDDGGSDAGEDQLHPDCYSISVSELPVLARWLRLQRPAAYKVLGEASAVMRGIDTLVRWPCPPSLAEHGPRGGRRRL